MNKRQFIAPYILLSTGGGSVVGPGSGQGGLDQPASPMSYSDWLSSDWAEDIILDEEINEEDYAAWWESWNFSREDWIRLNPTLSWEDYFG